MTAGKELAGPLITFPDGTKVAYDAPRDTCDPRWEACRIHRPACDCREAEFAEALGEYRAHSNEVEATIREVLRDHVTWAFLPGTGEWDYARRCQCTGCQIARSANLRPIHHQQRDGVPIYRPPGREPPR